MIRQSVYQVEKLIEGEADAREYQLVQKQCARQLLNYVGVAFYKGLRGF